MCAREKLFLSETLVVNLWQVSNELLRSSKMMPISELPLGIFPSEAAQKMEDPRRSMRSGSVRGGGRKTLDEARKFSGMFMDKWTGAQGKKYFFLAKNQFTSRLVWWGRFFKKKVPLQVRDGENLVCCSDYFHLCDVKSRWCVSFPEQGLMPK